MQRSVDWNSKEFDISNFPGNEYCGKKWFLKSHFLSSNGLPPKSASQFFFFSMLSVTHIIWHLIVSTSTWLPILLTWFLEDIFCLLENSKSYRIQKTRRMAGTKNHRLHFDTFAHKKCGGNISRICTKIFTPIDRVLLQSFTSTACWHRSRRITNSNNRPAAHVCANEYNARQTDRQTSGSGWSSTRAFDDFTCDPAQAAARAVGPEPAAAAEVS